jgi:hypothetical protein
LHRNLFATAGRTFDLRGFCHIGCHRDTDTTKQLNPFGNRVDQFILLAMMLVIEQMKLLERWPSNLPVRLLIQLAKNDGIGQQGVELLRHLQTNRLLQFKRQLVVHGPVVLEFSGVLMKPGLCIQGPYGSVPAHSVSSSLFLLCGVRNFASVCR